MSNPVFDDLKRMYKGEAMFRPSSIGRTMACPGSVALSAKALAGGFRRFSSRYALEGTAAHIVAEQALKGLRQPEEWTDRMVQVDGGAGMHGHFVDEEMVAAVNEYLEEVRCDVMDGDTLLTEHRMSLGALDPSDPVLAENRGTGDAVILRPRIGRITIKDLKYGKGVMVAGDAPQLRNYAVLAILGFPEIQWREVELVVSQPRAMQEHERRKSFIFDVADLMMNFLGELLQAFHFALQPDPPLKVGSHCRWCPAKDAGICPAIQEEALNIGRDAFAPLPGFTAKSMMGPLPGYVHLTTHGESKPPVLPLGVMPGAPPGVTGAAFGGPSDIRTGELITAGTPPIVRTVVLPSVADLAAADVATILERRHLYDIWITAVEERACSLIEAGVTVPGWMLSARAGNRKWVGEEKETQEALRAIGVKLVEMYSTPKLLSPAQIEKKLRPEARGLLEPLVERPKGKPTLMPVKEGRIGLPVVKMGAIENA